MSYRVSLSYWNCPLVCPAGMVSLVNKPGLSVCCRCLWHRLRLVSLVSRPYPLCRVVTSSKPSSRWSAKTWEGAALWGAVEEWGVGCSHPPSWPSTPRLHQTSCSSRILDAASWQPSDRMSPVTVAIAVATVTDTPMSVVRVADPLWSDRGHLGGQGRQRQGQRVLAGGQDGSFLATSCKFQSCHLTREFSLNLIRCVLLCEILLLVPL